MNTIHACVEDDLRGSIDGLLFQRRPRRAQAAAGRLKKRLESTLLQPPRELPARVVGRSQQRWDMEVDRTLLFEIDPPDIGTQTVFYRSGRHFQIAEYEEVAAPRESGAEEGQTSGAGLPVAKVGDAVAAAGEAEEQWLQQTQQAGEAAARAREQATAASAANLQRVVKPVSGGLLTAAPGLERGITFRSREEKADRSGPEAQTVREDLAGEEEEGGSKASAGIQAGIDAGEIEKEEADASEDDIALDELLPVEFPSLQPTGQMMAKKNRREWAHMVDLSGGSANFGRLGGAAELARTWPFELDAFQKEAIYHLECGESVFVAAHTSAGKTVVAEYAIALAQKHQTKTIYTSPIKALSNQKFRDFKHEFGDVGILTGDVQINPAAKCLIMTTEILRSKLYGQADLLREVEFVVFDEVHYVSDSERGVVWEEVIILLPEHVTLILLSATVPNTYEFASWVGRTRRRDVYVISTAKRPVPLEHFMWSGGKTERIVSADRKWQEGGYRAVVDRIRAAQTKTVGSEVAGGSGRGGRGGGPGGSGGRGGRGGQRGGQRGGGRGGGLVRGGGAGGGRGSGSNRGQARGSGHVGPSRPSLAQEKTLWADVVRFLRKSSLLPACIFVFSRVRCEELAQSLGTLDFCDAADKTRILAIYSRSITRLAREDQDLPQIGRLRALAVRGIAVHHGGLLPIAKEIVELLFAQSLVKVLFATETFAVGLNLPTRTVVFSDHRKFDGTRRRVLSPGEYTQMAGRAGRRGLDSVGTTIIVPPADGREIPAAEMLKTLILGQPARLTSQFRLTYNMILSLHRVETLRVEDMLKRSFSENASQSRRPEHEDRLHTLEAELAACLRARPNCDICDLYDGENQTHAPAARHQPMAVCHLAAQTFRQDSQQLLRKLACLSASSGGGAAVFCRGRIVLFTNEHGVRTVGFLADDIRPVPGATDITLSVFEVMPPRGASDNTDTLAFVPALRCFLPPPIARLPTVRAATVPLTQVEHVANFVLPLGDDPEATLARHLADGIDLSWTAPIWDDVHLERVRDVDVVWYVDNRQAKAKVVAESSALGCPDFVQHYAMRHQEWSIQDRLATMRRQMDDSSLALLPEYQNRLSVLKHLGFVNASSVVLLKGRVACEIRTADELVLTEVILNNLLADLDPPTIAALLSIFVYQGKDDTDLDAAPVLSPVLSTRLGDTYRIRKDIIRTQEQFHVLADGDEIESASRLHFGLMEVVYEWARGSPFKTIAGMTTEQEGTIVRTITRLEETCREVRNIGRIIGDTTLEEKMGGVKEAIMRNITTVPSLYL